MTSAGAFIPTADRGRRLGQPAGWLLGLAITMLIAAVLALAVFACTVAASEPWARAGGRPLSRRPILNWNSLSTVTIAEESVAIQSSIASIS